METLRAQRAELLSEIYPLLDNDEAVRKMTEFVKDLSMNTGLSIRKGWAQAAQKQHEEGLDRMFDSDVLDVESLEDWTW